MERMANPALAVADRAYVLETGHITTQGAGPGLAGRGPRTRQRSGRIGVVRASQYPYGVPIYGLAFAVLLLGEPLNPWYGLGLALVLGGTWLGTRR